MSSLTSISNSDWQKLDRAGKIALAHRLSRLEAKKSDVLHGYDAYQSDPVGFVRTCLGGDPWPLQEAIMQATADHRRVAVRSCHHSGKTWLASALVPWWLNAFDHSLVITTAPTDRQMREQLWVEIAGHHRKSELPGRITETSLEIGPSRRAFGFSTNTPERFQGWHEQNILVIVDEASGVAEPIYQAIEGILTGHNAKLLLIGNPNSPQGTFYEAFRSPLYQTFHISAHDVPERLLPASWAEERLQEWGADNPAYQVRVLGEFPQQGEDALIRMSWVTDAEERTLDAEGEVIIGVDVARYGGDESVAYVRQGSVVLGAIAWRGNDTMASAGRVAAMAREWNASVVNVDEIGVGAGVVDRLAEEFADDRNVTVVGVNVGEAAIDSEHYANKRSEIFQGLADRFKQGDISLPGEDSILLSQLTALKFSYRGRRWAGHRRIGPTRLRSHFARQARAGCRGPGRRRKDGRCGDRRVLCVLVTTTSYMPEPRAREKPTTCWRRACASTGRDILLISSTGPRRRFGRCGRR